MADVAVSLLLPVPKAGGAPGEGSGYQPIKDFVTDYAADYNGPSEVAVATFATGPEQLDYIFNFLRDAYIRDQMEALEAHGAHLLRLRVWRDTSPTWKTLYKVELTADVRGESKLAMPFPWLAVVAVGLLALALYFLVKPVIESVTDLFWGREGDDGGGGPLSGLPLGGLALAGIALAAVAVSRRRRESK